ncbi:MAG: hypothetical protein ABXS91_10520 [Sulfurimonas sp.]
MSQKMVSNAILSLDEIVEHFNDKTNHCLYKKNDDGTITAYMCCDWEIVDAGEIILNGECGSGINFNPKTKKIVRVD